MLSGGYGGRVAEGFGGGGVSGEGGLVVDLVFSVELAL